jgi:hypothetical protein
MYFHLYRRHVDKKSFDGAPEYRQATFSETRVFASGYSFN